MFSHVMVASNDIDRSKKFYDALFEAVGGKPGERDAKGRLPPPHIATGEAGATLNIAVEAWSDDT